VVEIKMDTKPANLDSRRSLMEVLEFLSRRGVSTEVIQLAMVRAGISLEVARILAQCVATTPATTPAAPAALPSPAAPRQLDRSGRAAQIALQKMIGLMVLVGVIWGIGITLGFAVGMEMGFAQGVEDGLARIHHLVGL